MSNFQVNEEGEWPADKLSIRFPRSPGGGMEVSILNNPVFNNPVFNNPVFNS